ncbi:MAG: IPT/TIG domain-containing protein, partial [Solirubrobacteraceae bacterium]|nr:IPT/TIG domain-containing protein [Solirubrobacteraceae bacterium]
SKAPVVTGILGRIAYANFGGVAIVTGANFGGPITVTVGTKPAAVIGKLGNSTLLVGLPRLSAGTYPLVVTSPTGSSASTPATTVKYIPLFGWGFGGFGW